ncbi:UdgX family uracil-DNA binding protein [Allosphingosinicella sp.]|jgi:uracil-DNA glycosylase family protein|uniref:UdgX family uracil-DNA binding protein n=1 Tax=Allosphingosinicella sp. TaxID=2823234 RepID=UPI002EE1B12F
MPIVTLAHDSDFAGWRNAARALALRGVAAGEVEWRVGDAPTALSEPPGEHVFHVPRAFVDLARAAICHPDPERFSLLYALLVRLRSDANALEDDSDALVVRIRAMAAGKKPDAGALSGAMADNPRATPGSNFRSAWEAVRDEAMGCTRCHLYKFGTQTVFGEGPLDAKILFVGEQPGDQEDLAGRPFVGPAGRLFDRALGEAGVDRSTAYVTNAVKHFKFERRGKRRIHQKPDGGEIDACRWWLEQERLLLRPPVTVALGATAARSLFGRIMTIGASRGRSHRLPDGGEAWVTVHPSFLLRVQDNKEAEYARFVEDLRRIGERAKALA